MEERKQVEQKGAVSTHAENTAVDWRGRPSNPNNHGGMKAAAFVLGIYIYIYIHAPLIFSPFFLFSLLCLSFLCFKILINSALYFVYVTTTT